MNEVSRFVPAYYSFGAQASPWPDFYPDGGCRGSAESNVADSSDQSSESSGTDASSPHPPLALVQRCDPDDLSPSALYNRKRRLSWHPENCGSSFPYASDPVQATNCYTPAPDLVNNDCGAWGPVDLSSSSRSGYVAAEEGESYQNCGDFQQQQHQQDPPISFYPTPSAWNAGSYFPGEAQWGARPVAPLARHHQGAFPNPPPALQSFGSVRRTAMPVPKHSCSCQRLCTICNFSAIASAGVSRTRPAVPAPRTAVWTAPPPETEAELARKKTRKRTASVKERQRLRSVNDAIQVLKTYIPFEKMRHHKMSKVKILRFATDYIRELTNVLDTAHLQNGLQSFADSDESFLDSEHGVSTLDSNETFSR